MTKNVGGADRLIRVVLGIGLLALGFMHVVTGIGAIVAYAVGAVALITGVFRFCPAWSVVGVNTCKTVRG